MREHPHTHTHMERWNASSSIASSEVSDDREGEKDIVERQVFCADMIKSLK